MSILARCRRRFLFFLAAIAVVALLLVGCAKKSPPTSERTPYVEEDPVATFIETHMQPGSAAFFVPSPVKQDAAVEATLKIKPPNVSPQALQQELQQLAGKPGVGASENIMISSRMVAKLEADRKCDILARDPLDQAIVLANGAIWHWYVTPRVHGKVRLSVSLTAPVMIDGKETFYPVTSFRKTVTVVVTAHGIASELMSWLKEYWSVLVGLAAAVSAVAAWWRTHRKRPKPAGFTR